MTSSMLPLMAFLSATLPGAPGLHDCEVHLLVRTAGEFEIRRESVPDGEVRVFIQSDTLLSLIAPWSAGQSGEVVQRSQGPAAYAVRCDAGSTRVTVQSQRATPRELPVIAPGTLSRHRMRVSVTPGRGNPAVFIIESNGSIVRDTIAPPTDMFRGMIPLEAGDVSITTETREASAPSLTGTAVLRLGGPYFLATLAVQGGGRGDVIVDLGASRTLLTRGLLPPGVEPAALVAEEHGPGGQRTRSAGMGALGGEVPGVAAARIPQLAIDGLVFSDVRVNVLDSLPLIAGMRVAGIVGTDLLGAGAITRITAGASGAMLELTTEALAAPQLEAPFSRVGGLILLSARVGDRTIPLILDTGARSTLLSESAARSIGLVALQEGETFHGLDGKPLATRAAIIPVLRLGSGQLDSLRVNVAPLPVLEAMGIEEGGLLGQNLWEQFSAIEVDWTKQTVRFYPRQN